MKTQTLREEVPGGRSRHAVQIVHGCLYTRPPPLLPPPSYGSAFWPLGPKRTGAPSSGRRGKAPQIVFEDFRSEIGRHLLLGFSPPPPRGPPPPLPGGAGWGLRWTESAV